MPARVNGEKVASERIENRILLRSREAVRRNKIQSCPELIQITSLSSRADESQSSEPKKLPEEEKQKVAMAKTRAVIEMGEENRHKQR
jgi:hypothetical protein